MTFTTSHALRPIASGLALSGLVAIVAPKTQAFPIRFQLHYDPYTYERTQEDYKFCSAELLADGLDESAVAIVCATAYQPTELAKCVSQIDDNTAISPANALDACREVRRPLELATCTTSIDAAFAPDRPLNVLDSCRRSLLPLDFASCTIGIESNIDTPVDDMMAICLNPDDRVRDIFPTP